MMMVMMMVQRMMSSSFSFSLIFSSLSALAIADVLFSFWCVYVWLVCLFLWKHVIGKKGVKEGKKRGKQKYWCDKLSLQVKSSNFWAQIDEEKMKMSDEILAFLLLLFLSFPKRQTNLQLRCWCCCSFHLFLLYWDCTKNKQAKKLHFEKPRFSLSILSCLVHLSADVACFSSQFFTKNW